MTDERAKDAGDVRPSSLSHLIGQKQVIDVCRTTLDYCFQEQVSFPHCCMLGPPGVGKTALARIISHETATGFHELLGSAIASASELFAVLMRATDGDLIFVDEIHCLDRLLQHTLLVAIDDRRIHLPNNGGGVPQAIKLAEFSLIGATTDEHQLIRPLAERFRLMLRFDYYTVEELAEIVRTRSKCLGWPVEDEVTRAIAVRSKGVPRLGIRLLQSCWRVCRAAGHDLVTNEHLRRACALEQIDHRGLDATEQKYLLLLSEGPLRLNMLATMLGLPPRTISHVTESFLVRAGFVTKDRQGLRVLTSLGIEHSKAMQSQ